jgi:sugar lactone lactonase YvrE
MRVQSLCRFFFLAVLVIAFSSCSPPSQVAEQETGEVTGAATGSTLAECFDRATEAAELEDWDAALEACSAGLELEPNLPALVLWAARCEARLGDDEACRAHLEAAIRLGATADLAADEAYAGVLERPEFEELAGRLLANGTPMPPAEIVHRFADAELWPEGIAIDSQTGDLYIGSIARRTIFRLDPSGRVEELGGLAQDGVMEVLGMSVDSPRRTLWAATGLGAYQEPFDDQPRKNELLRYNLETGRLERRYSVPDDENRLLNDVVVAPDGTAWATETLRGELFRVLPGGEIELFRRYPDLVYLNGIALSDDGERLYLGHYGGLSVASPIDGSIASVRGPDMALGMIDGLSWVDDGLVMVQNSRHVNNRVVRVDLTPDGRRAAGLEVLPSGLPEGLIPYTCATGDDAVFVIAGAPFGLMDTGEAPQAPAVVALPLEPVG